MKNYTGIGCTRVYFCAECGAEIKDLNKMVQYGADRFCNADICACNHFDDRRPEDI